MRGVRHDVLAARDDPELRARIRARGLQVQTVVQRHEDTAATERLADHGHARSLDVGATCRKVDRGEDVTRLFDPERVSGSAALAVTAKVEEQHGVAMDE